MENLGKQLLNSAQEGAEGSGNSIGAHLLSKLTEGNADTKLVTEEIHQENIRGGRGSKGDPSEINKLINEAREEEVRIDQDLVKIKNDKEGLLFAIAELRIRELQAVKDKLSPFTIDKIRKELAEAQRSIEKFNGVLPESEAIKDHKQIQSIMSEWYGGKRDWKKEKERFRKAEETLKTEPRNIGALRDANSARVEMKETEEKLEATAKEAKRIAENSDPNSVRNMGIHHTDEETINEKDYLNNRQAERVALGIFGHKEANEEMQKEMSVEEKNMEQKLILEAVPEENMTPPAETTPQQATADNWQEKAVENFEKSGGIVLDDSTPVLREVAEPINTPEETLGVPAPAQEATEETSPAEKSSLPALTPEQIEVFVAKNKETRERILGNIARVEGEIEARAEKAGINKGLLRNVGERWNKVPTRYKLLLTVGMLASGIGSAAVGATTAVGALASIGAGLRAVGGAGLFVAIENGLKNRAEKNGDKRSGFEELRDTTLAATLSIIIVGVLPNMARDYAVEHGLFQKISEFFGFGNVTIETPMEASVETPVETATYVETAKAGDSIWKMAEHQLETNYGEKFTSLSPEKQTYLIDAVKDKITLGMSEEAANTLAIGQNMDFKQVLTDKDFMNGMFTNAQNLSPEQIANIQNYDAGATAETTADRASSSEVARAPEQNGEPAESGISRANAVVETEGLKGLFQYSENGAVEGFSMEGEASATDGQKLLNENWREIVRNNPSAGGENIDINAVNANATTVSMYEQMLDTLEKKGAGASPEADFLRSNIENTVIDTEKMHGDVFKNIEDFGKLEETIPLETAPHEIIPEETKDVLMEGVIHEASEQHIPTSFIQPEILPGNTAELAYVMASADAIINTDIDILFGESRFLGFGHTNGIDSINWKDPQVGFGGKTVTEIMNSAPSAVPAEGGKTFGVENFEATSRMKEYLSSVTNMTGINPNSNEKVVDFIRRASVAKLSK